VYPPIEVEVCPLFPNLTPYKQKHVKNVETYIEEYVGGTNDV